MQNVVPVSPLRTVHVNAKVDPSTATDTEVVAAATGASFRVLSVVVTSTAAQTVVFKSATTAVTAVFSLAAGVPLVLPYNPHGWFETVGGAALNVTTTAATPTAVQIQYIKLPA